MIVLANIQAATLRLSRDQQLAAARADARQSCDAHGHTIGPWRHGGYVADDEAVCVVCGSRLFITYGNSALQPLIGARVFGTAFGSACRPTAGRGYREVGPC